MKLTFKFKIQIIFFRYLENHLSNLFAGAWETRDVSPLPVDIPQATNDQARLFALNVDILFNPEPKYSFLALTNIIYNLLAIAGPGTLY